MLRSALLLHLLLALTVRADLADHVVIDEVYYDGAVSGDTDEFVELYNPTGAAVDISGWWLGDEETQGGGEFFGQIPGGTVLDAGGRLVIARDAAGFQAAHGFAADLEMGFALSNSGDEVILATGEYTGIVDAVAWENGSWAGVVSYGSTPSGQSMQRTPSGEDTDNCPADFVSGTPDPAGGGVIEPPAEEGAIQVWFNRSVNTGVASYQAAAGNSWFFTPAVAFIDEAQYSLDVCLYSLTDHTIGNAIEAAHNRGVTVRVITEAANNGSAAIQDLENLGIPVIDDTYGSNDGDGLMHNKFLIADARAGAPAGLGRVLTGSWNFNYGGQANDANNLLRADSDALADIFEAEFEEMWGGSGDSPNSSQSEFSGAKEDTNSENTTIDSIAVEAHFSPSDAVMGDIVSELAGADHEIHFCAFSFTRQDVSDAMRSRYNAGVTVQGVFDTDQNSIYSEYHDMTGSGQNPWSPPAPVILDDLPGLLHHKYILIDANHPDSDPVVIMGSANFSSAAQNSNDENLLILHDANLANQFYQEFAARYGASAPSVTPIADIQFTADSSGESPMLGQSVVVEGVVTNVHTSSLFVIQEAEGAWNGLSIYSPGHAVGIGQQVQVSGTVTEYFGLTELSPVSAIVDLGAGVLPEPATLDCASAKLEDWESVLVRVQDVVVSQTDLGFNIWEVTDGADSLEIDDQPFLYAPAVDEAFGSITGTMTWNFDSAKLSPRDANDLLPPLGAVSDLQITILGGSFVQLNWSPLPGATSYTVHRTTAPWEAPTPANQVASLGGTSHLEVLPAPEARYFYVVVAVGE